MSTWFQFACGPGLWYFSSIQNTVRPFANDIPRAVHDFYMKKKLQNFCQLEIRLFIDNAEMLEFYPDSLFSTAIWNSFWVLICLTATYSWFWIKNWCRSAILASSYSNLSMTIQNIGIAAWSVKSFEIDGTSLKQKMSSCILTAIEFIAIIFTLVCFSPRPAPWISIFLMHLILLIWEIPAGLDSAAAWSQKWSLVLISFGNCGPKAKAEENFSWKRYRKFHIIRGISYATCDMALEPVQKQFTWSDEGKDFHFCSSC